VTNNYSNSKGFKIVGDVETTTIRATLTWDAAVDLDLYGAVVKPAAQGRKPAAQGRKPAAQLRSGN
jgi:hypothetical protein